MRARWAEARVPQRKTNGLLQLYKLGQGSEKEGAWPWGWGWELADTLHKQLSIAGTVFPLWCFEVRNMDAVEASGFDGCWLKMICHFVSLNSPCTACISEKTSILPTTKVWCLQPVLKPPRFHYQSTKALSEEKNLTYHLQR